MVQELPKGSYQDASHMTPGSERASSAAVSNAVEAGGALGPGVSESSAHASKERKELLKRELDRYLRVLTTQGDPERIIVFGSMASGDVTAWSDIDLAVWGIPLDVFYRAVAVVAGSSPEFRVDLVAPDDCPSRIGASLSGKASSCERAPFEAGTPLLSAICME